MLEPALGGDRVKVLCNLISVSDNCRAVHPANLSFDYGRRGKYPNAGLTERFQERAVIKFADDPRRQAMVLEPVVEASPKCRML